MIRRRILAALSVMAVLVLISGTSPSLANVVKMDVSLSHSTLKAGEKQTAYLKVGLTGDAEKADPEKVPFNLAIVLDKSGSMSGEKIRRAREAAVLVVNQLSKDDIISIVSYDSVVQVVVPATKVRDREEIINKINQIKAGGNTALFGGVSKGAEEIRKFAELEHINRMILLSDGLANVGPSNPNDLAKLGRNLAKESIAVTTVGLGLDFNEDLMTQLAVASDGNHYFAEKASDVARAFERDLGAARTIVAQQAEVRIKCARGVRPVRTLGHDAEIDGQNVIGKIGQVYDGFERYLMLEVEIPASESGDTRKVAEVEVTYEGVDTGARDKLTSTVSVGFSEDERVVDKSVEKDVMVEAVAQIAYLNNMEAIHLRDMGKVKEAKKVLMSNSSFIQSNAEPLDSAKLRSLRIQVDQMPSEFEDEANWTRNRKSTMESQAEAQWQMRR